MRSLKNGTVWESQYWDRQMVPFLEPCAVVFTRRMKAFGMDSSHVDLLRRVTATMEVLICEASFCRCFWYQKWDRRLWKSLHWSFYWNGFSGPFLGRREGCNGQLLFASQLWWNNVLLSLVMVVCIAKSIKLQPFFNGMHQPTQWTCRIVSIKRVIPFWFKKLKAFCLHLCLQIIELKVGSFVWNEKNYFFQLSTSLRFAISKNLCIFGFLLFFCCDCFSILANVFELPTFTCLQAIEPMQN